METKNDAEGEWEDEESIMYRNRSDWKDITPIPQFDGPAPIVPIAYDEKYVDVMDYFRAIVAKDERSERALKLTEDAIAFNPSNYTVWHFRRLVVDAIKHDLQEELRYVGEVTKENIKTYQAWYHRRAIVTKIGHGESELEFTSEILNQDSKNYHAWQHRQWAISQFNLFNCLGSQGIDYINSLLDIDIRNNSAWSHRFFLLKHITGFDAETKKQEVEFTLNKIKLVPHNESAWNYLHGVAETNGGCLLDFPNIKAICDNLIADEPTPSFAYSSLANYLEFEAKLGKPGAEEDAKQLYLTLANTRDTIRSKYWLHRIQLIENRKK